MRTFIEVAERFVTAHKAPLIDACHFGRICVVPFFLGRPSLVKTAGLNLNWTILRAILSLRVSYSDPSFLMPTPETKTFQQ